MGQAVLATMTPEGEAVGDAGLVALLAEIVDRLADQGRAGLALGLGKLILGPDLAFGDADEGAHEWGRHLISTVYIAPH